VKPRWWLVSFFVVAALGTAGGWWAFHQADPGPQEEKAGPSGSPQVTGPPSSASAPPPEPPAWARSWALGLQYVHEVDFEQRISLVQAQPSQLPAPPVLHFVLKGLLTSTVVGAQGDRIHVQYLLRPSSFAFESDGHDALEAQSRANMQASLQAPFYATLNRQGAVLSLHMERSVDLVSQNVLRSLVASLQVVTPPEPLERWPSQELDTTGQFAASYRRLAGPRAFEKTRLRYLQLGTPEGLRPIDGGIRVTTTGGAQLVLDDKLWLESLNGQERVEVHPGEGFPTTVGEIQVRARQLERRTAPVLIGALEANKSRLVSTALSVQTVAPEPPEARLRRILRGGNLKGLLGELRALPADEEVRGPATAELMERLRALFLLEPSSASQVPAQLRGEKDRNTYSSLIGALSAASTPEAVRALSQVSADATLPVPVRVDAIAGLGVVEKPLQEGVEELRRLARNPEEDIRSTATLALGNTARNLRQNDDPSADSILDLLSQALRSSADPLEQALLLKAIANTADLRALPIIETALGSGSSLVREAAVVALRLIPDPAADRLLSARMLGDTSSDVRRSAVFASSFRPLEPLLPALEQALRTDSSEAVRAEIVRLIGENRYRLGNATALLTWASQNDPSAEIRHVATSFLNPSPAPGGP
jgi:HEAT repeat protein